ncbi:MAG: SMP-30/gluconolactonase/LRE family protein [Gammaproteobacteria bacterium]|nr:MAG: SMP-30/gluconolactonase/LRE family protein [Gammaproteobacteria bacterium]
MTVLAEGLRFPEGPIAMPDGSVILVEIARGTLTRVVDGETEVIAELGGGPNGAAIGPDGFCYVCNNGGFQWNTRADGRLFPGNEPENYASGRIEVVDLDTRRVEVLYTQCEGQPLRGPNDLVFDSSGGFWFTDHGKTRPREKDRTGVFYAKADGSHISEVIFPMEGPNGIGLSPDESELYVAETHTGRLWAYELDAPGTLRSKRRDRPDGGRLIQGRSGYYLFDSLAVQADGRVCVATIVDGGITILDPKGGAPEHVPMPDLLTTNICFGGDELKTAYITLSSTGQLVSMPWETAGLPLNYLNR